MNFKANGKLDRPGGWLGATLPELMNQMDKLVKLFPNGKQEAFYEDEKGYDYPWRLAFEGDDGMTFCVYVRYGEPRIGVDNLSEPHVQEFKTWLLSQVKR